MDNTNKTFYTMIALTLVLLGVTYFSNQNRKKIIVEDTTAVESEVESNSTEETHGETIEKKARFEILEQETTDNLNPIYENSQIKMIFDLNDAVIKNAYIKDTFLDKKDESKEKMYDVINGDSENASLRLKFGSWNKDITVAKLTGGNNRYNFRKENNIYIFTLKLRDIENDVIYDIEKKYTFLEDENLFKLDINLSNSKNIETKFDSTDIAYSFGWGPSFGEVREKTKRDLAYDMFTYLSNDKDLKKIKSNDKQLKKKSEKYLSFDKMGSDTYITSNGHYFTSLIYPVDTENYKYFFDFRKDSSKKYFGGFGRKTNNSKIKSEFYIYIGPKIPEVMAKYDNDDKNKYTKYGIYLNDTKISKVAKINVPIIGPIAVGLRFILKHIYNVVKNYGVAIILLTVLIKLVLYPLTHKSLVSQQKMSKLQPKIKEIQAKYKDKPELLNKKTMELYSKEGINPFGGCLPMLLQMPILFAMYQLLDRMVSLKGATFLWIKDLSSPDAIFNLPFTLPFIGDTFNLLPIIMIVSQILSSFTMPDAGGNSQTKMMLWMMPLMFFFFFYNVSSGLVLYWTIMNILGLIQQVFLNRFKSKLELKKA